MVVNFLWQFKLKYKDLKMSAGMLLKKVPTMMVEALRTALSSMSQDVELEVLVSPQYSCREKKK